MDAVGADPVDRLCAGFRRYVEVVDANRDAVVLTYRESRTMTAEGRERIKVLEVATADPLRVAIASGVAAGTMTCDDVDLVVYDMVMLGHVWALKHWRFRDRYTVEQYADAQLQVVLTALHA